MDTQANLLFERPRLPMMQQLLPLSLMPDVCAWCWHSCCCVFTVSRMLRVCCCGAVQWLGVLLCCVVWVLSWANDAYYTNLLFEQPRLPMMQQLLPLSLMPSCDCRFVFPWYVPWLRTIYVSVDACVGGA
jgi:hypothetical protein